MRLYRIQLPYPMQQFHYEEGFASWHAIERQSPDCWSSHIHSATECLTQICTFKQKLCNCEPIDLFQFAVDLRDRHLEFWQVLDTFFWWPPKRAQQQNTDLSPVVRTACIKIWLSYLLIGFLDTCFLSFLNMSSAVWLVSDFVSTPSALKQQLGIPTLPLLATCVRLMRCPGWEICSLNATKEQHKISATFSKEHPLLSTSSSWVWVAPSTTLTLWSLSRNWVLILKELGSLPPSSMCTLWIFLLSLSIPEDFRGGTLE